MRSSSPFPLHCFLSTLALVSPLTLQLSGGPLWRLCSSKFLTIIMLTRHRRVRPPSLYPSQTVRHKSHVGLTTFSGLWTSLAFFGSKISDKRPSIAYTRLNPLVTAHLLLSNKVFHPVLVARPLYLPSHVSLVWVKNAASSEHVYKAIQPQGHP